MSDLCVKLVFDNDREEGAGSSILTNLKNIATFNLLEGSPRVHRGFHKQYFSNRVDEDLEKKVKELWTDLSSRPSNDKPPEIFITGHSLGAALATFCAYRLAVENVLDLPPETPITMVSI